MTLRVVVDVVVQDRSRDFDDRVRAALPAAGDAMLRFYQSELLTAVDVQAVPGPPLKPETVQRKRRLLRAAGEPTSRATAKWQMFDKAIAQSTIVTQPSGRSEALTELLTPPDGSRPLWLYHALESGAVLPNGAVIPARPLFRDTAIRSARGMARAFGQSLQEALR